MATVVEGTRRGTSTTLTEDINKQYQLLHHMAQQIDNNGFAVNLTGANQIGQTPEFMFSFMSGGFSQMVASWGAARGHTPLIIYVTPATVSCKGKTYAELLAGPLAFQLTIDRLAKLRPVMVAIEFVAQKAGWHNPAIVRDQITYAEDSNKYIIRGNSREQLETLVNILSMPQHRKILTNPVRKPGKDYLANT